jgi:hypothetical protein
MVSFGAQTAAGYGKVPTHFPVSEMYPPHAKGASAGEFLTAHRFVKSSPPKLVMCISPAP